MLMTDKVSLQWWWEEPKRVSKFIKMAGMPNPGE